MCKLRKGSSEIQILKPLELYVNQNWLQYDIRFDVYK